MQAILGIISLLALVWFCREQKCKCGGRFIAWDERRAYCDRCGTKE